MRLHYGISLHYEVDFTNVYHAYSINIVLTKTNLTLTPILLLIKRS